MNTEPREPTTPAALKSKTWNAARPKFKKKSWEFQKAKTRGQLPELSAVIKPVTFGSKIYKMGQYQGTLAELKEFAAFKGMTVLRNGIITYKVA